MKKNKEGLDDYSEDCVHGEVCNKLPCNLGSSGKPVCFKEKK